MGNHRKVHGVPFAACVLFAAVASPAIAQKITEFPLPKDSSPYEIAAGPDGNLWFTEFKYDAAIGRMSTDGAVTEFPIPNRYVSPSGIAVGPDGNIWFTEANFEMGLASLREIRGRAVAAGPARAATAEELKI